MRAGGSRSEATKEINMYFVISSVDDQTTPAKFAVFYSLSLIQVIFGFSFLSMFTVFSFSIILSALIVSIGRCEVLSHSVSLGFCFILFMILIGCYV